MCSDSLNGRASEIVIKRSLVRLLSVAVGISEGSRQKCTDFPFPGKPVRLTAVVISHKRELFLNKDDDGF